MCVDCAFFQKVKIPLKEAQPFGIPDVRGCVRADGTAGETIVASGHRNESLGLAKPGFQVGQLAPCIFEFPVLFRDLIVIQFELTGGFCPSGRIAP